MKKYPVITLCGSTRFKKEFEKIQKEFTLNGYIVISVGLFGHSDDMEVWEGKNEGDLTKTKLMLDDMHKTKIDMADEVFIINPEGYIGDSTWSEICYAGMTDKDIYALNPISPELIEAKIQHHILLAEGLAARQNDVFVHTASDYSDGGEWMLREMTTIKHKRNIILDPWIPEDVRTPTTDFPYIQHGDKSKGFDPFKIYGKKKMARFIETIVMKNNIESKDDTSVKKRKLLEEIDWYISACNLNVPKNYPDMTMEEMEDFVACWSEFDPWPELK